MKKLSALLLVPAIASAAILDVRQAPGGFTLKGTAVPVAFVRDLKPEVRSDAIHQIVGLGPIQLKGTKDAQQSHFLSATNAFCKSCTVLKGRAGIELKGGESIGNKTVYIHHILTNDGSKETTPFISRCTSPEAAAPKAPSSASGGSQPSGGLTGGLGSKFIGTGDDQMGVSTWYTTRDGKFDSGFQINEGDTFNMNVNLVNNQDIPREVYVTMELEYLKGHIGVHTRDVLLPVQGCNISVPISLSNAGPTNTTSGRFYFYEDGTIVFAKGHLHSGGEKMVMYINDKFACESKATYGNGPQGSITSMEVCPQPLVVKKGDYLSMTAVYDASKHPIRHTGGMGGMGGTTGMGGKGGKGDRPDIMGMWAFAFANQTKSSI